MDELSQLSGTMPTTQAPSKAIDEIMEQSPVKRRAIAKKTDVEGVVEFDRLYHGSPQTDLIEVSTSSSKSIERTKGTHAPSVHLSDDPLLSNLLPEGS